MKKVTDIIVLILVAILFFSVVMLNILQTDRPSFSESEQRELAKMPKWSVAALLDGSYFKGVDAFVSDTFYARGALVDQAKSFKLLFGLSDDGFILLDQNKTETDDGELDIPQEVLDALNGTAATETPVTEPPETEPPVTDEVTTVPPISVVLDKETVNIIAGSGVSVHAAPSIDGQVELIWTLDGEGIVEMVQKDGNTVDLRGLANGTATLTVTTPDGLSASCTVSVIAPASSGEVIKVENADFLPSGLFIYGDAVYSNVYYSESSSNRYAQTLAYYATLFPSARVHAVVSPLSSMLIEDETIKAKLSDQKKMLADLGGMMDERVNMVDVYGALEAHKNEYLFFKSDHHWTARAAYYAYAAYAESVGLTPTPLEDLGYLTISDNYHGSMYSFTKDERVRSFVDVIEAFKPTKPHTMTVHTQSGGTLRYDSVIREKTKTYVTFIAGDNPYTVINVPDNPQDFNVMVLKDSFGNALIPFLCEHYGNIIVVDPRYVDFNIYETWKDYPLSDIIFANNIQSPNSAAWSRMYLAAVGVVTEK